MVCTKSFTLYENLDKFTVNLHFQSFVVKLDLIKQSMKKKVHCCAVYGWNCKPGELTISFIICKQQTGWLRPARPGHLHREHIHACAALITGSLWKDCDPVLWSTFSLLSHPFASDVIKTSNVCVLSWREQGHSLYYSIIYWHAANHMTGRLCPPLSSVAQEKPFSTDTFTHCYLSVTSLSASTYLKASKTISTHRRPLFVPLLSQLLSLQNMCCV